jgi:hypothetical protein
MKIKRREIIDMPEKQTVRPHKAYVIVNAGGWIFPSTIRTLRREAIAAYEEPSGWSFKVDRKKYGIRVEPITIQQRGSDD